MRWDALADCGEAVSEVMLPLLKERSNGAPFKGFQHPVDRWKLPAGKDGQHVVQKAWEELCVCLVRGQECVSHFCGILTQKKRGRCPGDDQSICTVSCAGFNTCFANGQEFNGGQEQCLQGGVHKGGHDVKSPSARPSLTGDDVKLQSALGSAQYQLFAN